MCLCACVIIYVCVGVYIYICLFMYVYMYIDVCVCSLGGCLVGFYGISTVVGYSNVKYIFMQIVSSVSNNSV